MTRTTGGNRRLAQWRVKWLIEHSTSHQLLWCIDSFVLRNPPLRQAPKRYKQLQLDRHTIDMRTLIIIFLCSMLTSSAQIDSIIRVHFSKINPDSISAITDNFNNKFRKQKLSISLNKEIDRNLVLDFYATQWKLEYSVWADSTFESGTSDYFYINIFREHSEIFKLSYIDTSGRQIKLFDDKKISESMMSSYNTLFNVKLDTSATFRTKKSFEFLQFPSEILDKIVRKKDIKPVMALLQSQFPEDRLNGIRLVNKLRQQKFTLLDERVNTTYNLASATKGLVFSCWADLCEWTKFQDELKNVNNRQTE